MKKLRTIFSIRWLRIVFIFALALIATNAWLSHRIKSGLRDLAGEIQKSEDPRSDFFYWVGPATTYSIKEVTKSDYSISVWPFDWFGTGEFVTHTAFIKSSEKEIGIRIRFNPLDRFFHIVGFYTVR
jgi:hypothetical protein